MHSTSYLDDDVLPPVVEEVLDVPHHCCVGPVVAVGHLLERPLEALREGEVGPLLEVGQGQLEEPLLQEVGILLHVPLAAKGFGPAR